ncbi:MAG: FG-GAP-like repeat-containing protein [Candidatus Altiarchaeota archaeon]
MRSRVFASSIALLILLGTCACAQDYMGLLWNQTVKEILSDIDVGDVNGDGRLEVAVSGSSDGLVYLFDSAGNALWKRDVASYINAVKVADLDGDGRAEVVTGHADMYVFNSTGSRVGQFSTQNGVFQIKAADVSGDGKNDIILASYDKGSCDNGFIYALDCSGNSAGVPCRQLWKYDVGKSIPFDFDVADYDGDGRKEIAVGLVYRASGSNKMSGCEKVFNKPSAVQVLKSDGTLLWQYQTASGIMAVGSGDIRGDGKKAIVAGGYPDLYVISSDGKLLWSDSKTALSYVQSVAVADLYGDNRSEVLAGSNKLTVYDDQGKMLWSGDTDSRVYSLAAGDIDHTGIPSIIVGSSSIFVFDGKGAQRWKSPSHTSYGFVRVADIDGNGYGDVISGSVKGVYAFQTMEYAKRVRADELYKQAIILATTNPTLAVEKMREARNLYGELNMMDKVSDTINQIARLTDTTGKAGDLMAGAESDLNMSKALLAAGDHINASKYAMSARDMYNAPQVNNKVKAAEADEIIALAKVVLAGNASDELMLANESYHMRDYNASLAHALKAQEYFDFIGDMERRQKAAEVAYGLRELMGLNPKNQTTDLILNDLYGLPQKLKGLSPMLLVLVILAAAIVVMMFAVTLYFWRLSRRKTLNLENLHKTRYPKDEEIPKAQEEPLSHRRELQTKVEKYRTTQEDEYKSMFPPSSRGEPSLRRIPPAERHKPADAEKKPAKPLPEEASRPALQGRPADMPRPARTFEPPVRVPEKKQQQAPEAQTPLAPNKGIVKMRICRRGLCLKTKPIRKSVRGF